MPTTNQTRGVSVPDSSSTGNEIQGWLWKRSGVFSLWKRKYFVLRGPLLSYYDMYPAEEFTSSSSTPHMNTRGDCTPRGVLRVVHIENCSTGFKVFGSSGKMIHVRAESTSTDKRWINACRRAAAMLQRLKDTSSPSVESFMCTVESIQSDITTCSSSSSVSEGHDLNGWLRCSKGIKFFVVQGNMLTMYENNQPWCVPTYRGYVCGVSKKGYQDFQVTLSGGKIYDLQATSSPERDAWAHLLRQCSVAR